MRQIVLLFNSKSSYFYNFCSDFGSWGGLASARSLMIVNLLNYAYICFASNIGIGKQQFSKFINWIAKTIKGFWFVNLYNGIGVSIIGIILCYKVYFSLFNTFFRYNCY